MLDTPCPVPENMHHGVHAMRVDHRMTGDRAQELPIAASTSFICPFFEKEDEKT
jgi:hypothetical protein